ncbi:MAG: rRNA pseudouridine synthase [Lentisphaeraceae bacterium]|nr:rRNA pseudouridine synthase [Lentisphaeraceae bacterium]
MRLAKFIAMAGIASRRAAEDLIRDGKVILNGRRCTEVATIVDPDFDDVTIKGRRLVVKEKVYLALNKPVGYACTNNDPFETQTIYRLLPRKERLFSVGRLDKNSEGLLLITNDGEFSNKLAHPRYELEKKYRVTVTGPISLRGLKEVVDEGVEFEGETYKVKDMQVHRRYKGGGILNITLTEGKNREIRKICKYLNLTVNKLKRNQIGDLKLAELPIGTWRKLTKDEIEDLMKPKS